MLLGITSSVLLAIADTQSRLAWCSARISACTGFGAATAASADGVGRGGAGVAASVRVACVSRGPGVVDGDGDAVVDGDGDAVVDGDGDGDAVVDGEDGHAESRPNKLAIRKTGCRCMGILSPCVDGASDTLRMPQARTPGGEGKGGSAAQSTQPCAPTS